TLNFPVRNGIKRPQLQGHLGWRDDRALSVWILPFRMGQCEQVLVGHLLGHAGIDKVFIDMRIARQLGTATQTASIRSNWAARSMHFDYLGTCYEVAFRAIIRHDPEVAVIIEFSGDNNEHLVAPAGQYLVP